MSPSRLRARLLAPVLPSTMAPVPPKIWVPMNDSTLLLLISTPPLTIVSPLVTRSTVVPLAMSITPASVTLVRKLLLLLLGVNRPLPVELIVPPITVTPFWMTVLPSAASMWPAPVFVTALFKRKVPPLAAPSVAALLVCAALRSMRPPATSARMLPLFTSTCAPPAR